MDKGVIFTLMETAMKVPGRMTKRMGKVYIYTLQRGRNMSGSSRMGSNMELVLLTSHMETDMKVNGKMV